MSRRLAQRGRLEFMLRRLLERERRLGPAYAFSNDTMAIISYDMVSFSRHRRVPPFVITLLLHCYYIVITLLLHCYYIVITLLLHCYYIVITLLLHCYYIVITLLLAVNMDGVKKNPLEQICYTHQPCVPLINITM